MHEVRSAGGVTGSQASGAAERGALVLQASGVGKSFGGIAALSDVDFDLKARRGARAGRRERRRQVDLDEDPRRRARRVRRRHFARRRAGEFAGVQDAERAGVAIIHQELDLVPELTAADNIFLGREPLIAGTIVDRRRITKAARALLARLGIDIDPQSRVGDLRVGEQQLVEIAKALSLDARILMMDEPTSALSSTECETLFKVVRQLAAAGVAIIFTSHRIDEVVALADRVTVLRDGRHVLTAPIEKLSSGAIISAMVGRDVALTHRERKAAGGAPVLSVRDLTLDTVSRRGWRRVLHGVSFDLRRGEILGIGGLLGSGRTEILEFIFGAARGWRGGEIAIDGKPAVSQLAERTRSRSGSRW